MPWGISESAFYSFDNQLNYQYKAHGVQKLGLKRGLDQELVVSPYSSLLTLPYDFYDSYHNLKQMEHLGLVGEYGFFEACDYTRSRCEGKEGQIVRSFMAHHVGMSLLSIANTLNDFSMHKRFMKDKQMQGARELLEEKIPSQPVIYENVPAKEVCEPHKRVAGQAQEYDVLTPQGMHAHMLQNGVYSSLITDIGIGMARYGGLYLTRYSKDFLNAPYGVYAF